jgi:hypothetical protein
LYNPWTCLPSPSWLLPPVSCSAWEEVATCCVVRSEFVLGSVRETNSNELAQ